MTYSYQSPPLQVMTHDFIFIEIPADPALTHHREAKLDEVEDKFSYSKSNFKDTKEVLKIAQNRLLACVKRA